ncbi:hypothetical protein DYB30_008723 [Aphanomyces astaci]|uniref:Pentatricopeptide repeat-containing protein n=1 Tax=Aphanomyces astaci TaxID=112090 RepID=A0A397CEJ8_APHAT|nr:hypothetical protein DYB30_008723 [Aphanomyces astaci]
MQPRCLHDKNRAFLCVMRTTQALIGTATIIAMMLAYGSFLLEDGDMYRYAQTYHFCVVVVGYTALQYGAWYVVFVSYMQRCVLDEILERFLDIILLITSLVCGYLTNLKTGCHELVAKETYGRCSNLQVTMILCFSNAVLFSLLLVYNLLVTIPSNSSHPDCTMNLAPRGNYGVNATPVVSALPVNGVHDGELHGNPSVPMLSPLWDVLSTSHTMDKAPPSDEDKTANLHPRGQFGIPLKIDDVDKTDRLLPRGNFGSLASMQSSLPSVDEVLRMWERSCTEDVDLLPQVWRTLEAHYPEGIPQVLLASTLAALWSKRKFTDIIAMAPLATASTLSSDVVDFVVRAHCAQNDIQGAETFLAASSHASNMTLQSRLVLAYASQRDISRVKSIILQHIVEQPTHMWNAQSCRNVMSALGQLRDVPSMFEFLRRMTDRGVEADCFIVASLLEACVATANAADATRVLANVPALNLAPHPTFLKPSTSIFNNRLCHAVLRAHVLLGHFQAIPSVLDELHMLPPHPSTPRILRHVCSAAIKAQHYDVACASLASPDQFAHVVQHASPRDVPAIIAQVLSSPSTGKLELLVTGLQVAHKRRDKRALRTFYLAAPPPVRVDPRVHQIFHASSADMDMPILPPSVNKVLGLVQAKDYRKAIAHLTRHPIHHPATWDAFLSHLVPPLDPDPRCAATTPIEWSFAIDACLLHNRNVQAINLFVGRMLSTPTHRSVFVPKPTALLQLETACRRLSVDEQRHLHTTKLLQVLMDQFAACPRAFPVSARVGLMRVGLLLRSPQLTLLVLPEKCHQWDFTMLKMVITAASETHQVEEMFRKAPASLQIKLLREYRRRGQWKEAPVNMDVLPRLLDAGAFGDVLRLRTMLPVHVHHLQSHDRWNEFLDTLAPQIT